MQRIKNRLIPGADQLTIGLDIFFEDTNQSKPVVFTSMDLTGLKIGAISI